ncbi:uncharacterized protein JCM15063_001962 [Sporobolomyces koalae]|uniref:uncharacterized protein n=1 Tax=Sporobolomyces koalae TaxID=500713 RepID=UPI0031717037
MPLDHLLNPLRDPQDALTALRNLLERTDLANGWSVSISDYLSSKSDIVGDRFAKELEIVHQRIERLINENPSARERLGQSWYFLAEARIVRIDLIDRSSQPLTLKEIQPPLEMLARKCAPQATLPSDSWYHEQTVRVPE